MRGFADHFSRLAAGYAAYRPRYPDGLYQALAAVAPSRERVWDCATGTGQAASGLARIFREVLASDASAAQIRAAPAHSGVRYFVARAEAVPLPSAAVGLVTVAQALHWLQLPAFYAEVRRVLMAGGVLAAWTYGRQRVDGGPIDAVIDHFYRHIVGPYWPPERRWVETGYRTLAFPFDELPIRTPPMVARWTLPQLLGYIATWSAVARYREVTGADPLADLARRLRPLWGASSKARRIEWPLQVRAGR